MNASASSRFPAPHIPLWERVLYAVGRGLLLVFAAVWFRLSVEGRDNVPTEGPFVLAPVHRSNLDFLLVSKVTRRRLRYMGKDSLWKRRAFGRLLSALGAFPVNRSTADREALKTSIEVVEKGEPLVLFAEGRRQSGPVVQPLFDGAAYVACRCQIPIVPVGIGGSERAMPRGSKMIFPRKIHLIVGEPMQPAPLKPSGAVSRSAVKELSEQLAKQLQELFDAAQIRVIG